MAPGAETVQVAGNDSQTIDSRHRQPFRADEDIPNDGEKDVSKSKKPHVLQHWKISNASDGSNGGHGFRPDLMKKDIHALEAHSSGSHARSHILFSGFMKGTSSGSQEFKNVGDGEHHHHYHHPHGTRDKDIFGSKDAEENYREHDDLFGSRDMEYQQNIEKADSLFGFEDKKFEREGKERYLFGSEDPDTLSFREKMNIVGPVDADTDEIERTRHVFGDENAENSDDDVGSDDDRKREKKVHSVGEHHHHHRSQS